jgi:hypothetical protein
MVDILYAENIRQNYNKIARELIWSSIVYTPKGSGKAQTSVGEQARYLQQRLGSIG